MLKYRLASPPKTVANESARLVLTKLEVVENQLVIEDDTKKVYMVVDTSNLSNDYGYCYIGVVGVRG